MAENDMYDVKTRDDLPFTPQSGDVSAPASNTAATITYNPGQYRKQSFQGLLWSYNGVPTNGQVTIVIDGVSLKFYITNGGPGFIWFPRRMGGRQIVITLAAGGSGVSGTLCVLDHQTR